MKTFSVIAISVSLFTAVQAAAFERILFLGDSVGCCPGAGEDDCLPHLLLKGLRGRYSEPRMINLSVGGAVAAQGTALLSAHSHPPHSVVLCIVELGGNDARTGATPVSVEAALEKLCGAIRRDYPNARIVLIGLGAGLFNGSNPYAAVAAKMRVSAVFGFEWEMVDRRHMRSQDNVHPNKQGIREIAQRVLACIEHDQSEPN